MDSPSLPLPSTTTTLTIEALPAEIIVQIVTNNLPYYDIFALQTVCRRLRTILLNEFWPKVRTLALSTLEEPGNPLSASLIISNHYEGTETLEITQGHLRAMLGYCAKSLNCFNVSHHPGWLWHLGIPKTQYWNFCCSQEYRDNNYSDENPPPDAVKVVPLKLACSGQGICEMLTFCCTSSSLSCLDLSGIPVTDGAKSLLAIASVFGGTLRILRLRECLKSIFNPPLSIVYSPIEPAEFEAFLAACPQLVELDISGNKLAHTLRFSSISPKLRAFKAFWATLEIDQFIEVINAAPRIEHLQITLDLHTHPSQQDLDKFMLALPKLCKLQQLWLVYMISPGTPSLRVRFLPSSTPALKVLRIGQCNNDDVPFVQSALTEWHEFNKLHQLRELYVCQGGNISAQQWHQFSTSAQNLTTLSFLLCGTIDDAALANIARNCRQIKELRITLCQNVTWRGLAIFLDFSKSIHIFEAAEQMTDELLEKVMDTMDNDNNCCSPCNNGGSSNSSSRGHQQQTNCHRPFFYFIRFQLNLYWCDYANPMCRQTESQNLHPCILYSRNKRELNEALFAYDPYSNWC